MQEYKKYLVGLLKLLGAALVVTALYVYIDQLVVNWNKIDSGQISISYFWGGLAISFVSMAYVLFTLAWQIALNGLGEVEGKISFFQCIGIYNSTQLAKYIPGKVWGYLIQTRVLGNYGINTYTTIYLNLLLSFSSVLCSLILGLIFLSYFLGHGSLIGILLALTIFLLALLYFYLNKSDSLNKGLKKLFGIFGKEIRILEINKSSFILTNIIIFLAVLCFGFSGFACALTIGMPYDSEMILPISSAMVFSDAIGFLVLVSPGGIGVREYVLFVMLDIIGIGISAVFIPVIARLTNMFADLLLGALGLYALYCEHKKMPSVSARIRTERQ